MSLRYLLWFAGGVALAAAGWVIGLNLGNDVAGIVIAASIVGSVAVAELWANKKK